MEAGQQKNLDAASRAYVQMTSSCVSCHKFIRQSSGTGSIFGLPAKALCREQVNDLGCVSAIDSNGRTIWIADAHRGDGKRFVVRADEKLTAFLELESAISARGQFH